MNKFDFLLELQKIDDNLIDEITNSRQTIKYSRLRIAIIAAAVLMVLSLVACGVYSAIAASSEVFTGRYANVNVYDRFDSLSPLKYDNGHVAELAMEYGFAKKDIVVEHYNEKINHGYYFDEIFIVTKETAVARVITDAKSFTFDVEFVGFFHNEKKNEFKAVSQKTTATGGIIEIVMHSEDGWECFGGFLGRSHPEEEINTFYGSSAMNNIDSRAILYMNKYSDKMLKDSNAVYTKEESEVAFINSFIYSSIHEDTFAPTESGNTIDRIEQIVSKYGMERISEDKTFYDKRILTNEQFLEVGYAYDKDGLVVFVNNTIENSTIKLFVSGVFYNAEKDEYRVVKSNSGETSSIIKMKSKNGWECIGVSMFRSMPESDDFEYTIVGDFTPVEGNENNSQKFWEKVKTEIEIEKNNWQIADENSQYKQSPHMHSLPDSPDDLVSDPMYSKEYTASNVSVYNDNEDEEMFPFILDYYDKKERLAYISKEYLGEMFVIAPPVYDPDFDYDKYNNEKSWTILSYDYDKTMDKAPHYPYYYEKGFVQIDNKVVVFNITNNNDIEFKILATGLFYNAEKDEYVSEEQYVETYGGSIITMTAKDGWELSGIVITTYAQGDDEPVTKNCGICSKGKAKGLYNQIIDKHKSEGFIKEFLAK